MPLSLKTVEPSRGVRWITDAWRLFLRRPLAFAGLLSTWILGGMLLSTLLPVVGSVVMLMSPPLMSLGFMIAGQSVLLDGPVHPRQFIEPLRADKRRRNAMLILCVVYAAVVTLTTVLALQIADEPLSKLAQQQSGTALPREEIIALLGSSEMTYATLLFTLVMSAIAAPFWHAPALVHWGGHSAGQALFSSLLAVWRNKAAFAVYFAVFTATGLMGLFVLSALVSALLPLWLALGLLVMAWAGAGAVFYLSVLFTFNDSFGGTPVLTDDDPVTQPDI
jgi:hypothetical protein